MKKAIYIAAIFMVSGAAQATGFLQNQSVNGMNRYCQYSDGVVFTVNAASLCPLNTDSLQQQERPRYNPLQNNGCDPRYPAACGKSFNPNAYDDK